MRALDSLQAPLGGVNLIEASAGTGKTYTIALLYVRLVLEQGLKAPDILVVTFTEAATAELAERIRNNLKAARRVLLEGQGGDESLEALVGRAPDPGLALARLTEALRCFDLAPICTIHAFCRRVLGEMAFETGTPFDLELITDVREIMQAVVDDFYRMHLTGDTLPEFAAYAAEKGLSPERLLHLAHRAGYETHLIPDEKLPDGDRLPVLMEDFRAATGELRRVFDRTQLAGLFNRLKEDGVLKARSHQTRWIEGRLEALEQWLFEEGAPENAYRLVFPRGDTLAWFTPRKLSGTLHPGKDLPDHPLFAACARLEQAISELRAALDGALIRLEIELCAYLRSELPRRKEAARVMHFDDLLLRLRDALQGPGGEHLAQALRARFAAALIDEFQDTDNLQYAIFARIFGQGDAPLFLIGDPKQSIYAFRGADIFAYLQASRTVAPERRYTLQHNWRSTPDLVQALNVLFGSRSRPFVFEEIDFSPVEAALPPGTKAFSGGAPFVLWFLPQEGPLTREQATAAITRAVGAEIVHLLAGGDTAKPSIDGRALEPREIAVLVRDNRQARRVRDELVSRGVPCVLSSDENVFQSREAFELEIVLQALAGPAQPGRLKAALSSALMGLNAAGIEALQNDLPQWEALTERLVRYRNLWERAGFIQMFRRLIQAEGAGARLLALPQGERRLTNVMHLAELLHAACLQHGLGIEEGLAWFSRQRALSSGRQEDQQLRLESDADAVRVLTVHRSKGLEFAVVFCPFAWGDSLPRQGDPYPVFHDEEHDMRPTMDLGSAELERSTALQVRENLAENLRLLYVALTRASSRLYLAWGQIRGAETSSLAYLLHAHRASIGEDLAASLSPLAGLAREDMLEDLQALAQRSRGRIALGEPPSAFADLTPLRTPPAAALTCRGLSRAIDRTWGLTSFTSLTAGSPPGAEPADRDTQVRAPLLPADQPESAAMPGILNLPRGARTGIMLHRIFEVIDFTDSVQAIRARVDATLAEYGFDAAWGVDVGVMVMDVLAAGLPGRGGRMRLRDVDPSERLSELEFSLALRRITPAGLQALLGGVHASEGLPGGQGRLSFEPVRGFLRGFIDLVFRHEGRYYLVDWKSNHLGWQLENYRPAALAGVMRASHYHLQYHLYTLALHRYLKVRLMDYDYERHFGGVYYLFLRGICPGRDTESGIFAARPDAGLIARMEESLVGIE